MRDFYIEYFWILFGSIPLYVYAGVLTFFAIGCIVFVRTYGIKKGLLLSSLLLLIEYVFILYGSTVFFRPSVEERMFNFTPLWSYFKYFRGEDSQLLSENIMNIAVFVPVGFLLGCLTFGFKWLGRKIRLLFFVLTGVVMSLGIELLQYVLYKGFAETDDVMNNTFGCLLGYGLFLICYRLFARPAANGE